MECGWARDGDLPGIPPHPIQATSGPAGHSATPKAQPVAVSHGGLSLSPFPHPSTFTYVTEQWETGCLVKIKLHGTFNLKGPPVCSKRDLAFGGILELAPPPPRPNPQKEIGPKVTGHGWDPCFPVPSHVVILTCYFLIICRSIWLHTSYKLFVG